MRGREVPIKLGWGFYYCEKGKFKIRSKLCKSSLNWASLNRKQGMGNDRGKHSAIMYALRCKEFFNFLNLKENIKVVQLLLISWTGFPIIAITDPLDRTLPQINTWKWSIWFFFRKDPLILFFFLWLILSDLDVIKNVFIFNLILRMFQSWF